MAFQDAGEVLSSIWLAIVLILVAVFTAAWIGVVAAYLAIGVG